MLLFLMIYKLILYKNVEDYLQNHCASATIRHSANNIAQVKDLFGVKERENYNISKSETYVRPKVRKVKAITEALKFLKVI